MRLCYLWRIPGFKREGVQVLPSSETKPSVWRLNIKKFHHFRFSKDEPGVVYCREYLSSPEQACMLLEDGAVIPPGSVLLQKINPERLSDERRNYLYREIRQFYKPGTEDLVAPVP